jgi:hypothetical protein
MPGSENWPRPKVAAAERGRRVPSGDGRDGLGGRDGRFRGASRRNSSFHFALPGK